jgi:hypothetical protein
MISVSTVCQCHGIPQPAADFSKAIEGSVRGLPRRRVAARQPGRFSGVTNLYWATFLATGWRCNREFRHKSQRLVTAATEAFPKRSAPPCESFRCRPSVRGNARWEAALGTKLGDSRGIGLTPLGWRRPPPRAHGLGSTLSSTRLALPPNISRTRAVLVLTEWETP